MLHGGPAAGDRRGGAGAARQGQGTGRRPRRGTRAVRQRPPLRGLLAPRRRTEQRLLQRDARRVREAPRAGGRAPAAARRGPGPARPRRPGPRAPPLRAARLGGHRRDRPAGHRVPRVGRLALRPPRTGVHDAHPRRGPAAPVRPPPGARRRQALLGLPGRGRQADAGRRGLAARPPGAGPDHQPLPVPPLVADPGGEGATGTGPAGRDRRQRRRGDRQRRRGGDRAGGPADPARRTAPRGDPDRPAGPRRRPRPRPRLRRGPPGAGTAQGAAVHRDRRRGRVGARAHHRLPPAPAGPHERAPGHPGQPVPGLPRLHGQAADGLRRRRAQRGDRARRPAPAARARLRGVRVRPPPHRRRHHAERRVQRALGDPPGRPRPPP